MVRRRHDAFPLHPLDQGRGAVVADRQAPLDVGGGRLAVAQDKRDGAVVEVVGLGECLEAARFTVVAQLLLVVLLQHR